MSKTTYELAIIVSDDVDVRDIEKAVGTLGRLETKAGSTGASLAAFGGVVAGSMLAVGTAVLAAGAYSLQAAGDAEEAGSKFGTVFGDLAGRVGGNIDEFAAAVGRSRFQLRGFAGDFGDTFQPLGFAADESAELSERLTQLTVDLASFNNLAEQDVAQALRSAVVGNTENLLQFGVVANEAAIKQKALELGLEGVNGQLTAQEKALAIVELTIAGTTAAQGDALRTADSFTNQQRTLAAQLQETATVAGSLLIPAATEIVVIFNDLASNAGPGLIATIEAIAPVAQTAARGLGTLTSSGTEFRQFQSDLERLVDSTLTAEEKIARIEAARGKRGIAEILLGGTGEELDRAEIEVIKDVIRGADDLYEAIERLQSAGIDGEVPFLLGYLEEANLEQAVEAVESFDRALLQTERSAAASSTELEAHGDAVATIAEQDAKATASSRTLAEAFGQVQAAYAARQAVIQNENRLFGESERLYTELVDAQTDLADASGEWVQVVTDNSGRIGRINSQLASDLSDDQRSAYQDILSTVEEGSAEWLAAYNGLQNDLSNSQREGLIAQRAALEESTGAVGSIYTGDASAAEEAQARIEAANAAIIESYRATAFEGLLAQNGVTESTLALGVGLGLITKEAADARLEFVTTTSAIEDLNASYEFLNATTNDQIEAVQLVALGYADSAEAALGLAGQIDGPFAASIRNANELTEKQIDLLNSLDGKTVTSSIRTNIIEGGRSFEGGGDGGGRGGGGVTSISNSGGNTINVYTGANEGDVKNALSAIGAQ